MSLLALSLITMPNCPLPSLQPEEWLTKRLVNTTESSPHFEALWYGVYNALLSHYFPYQQCFLIKPQPKIQEPLSKDMDVSFSSAQAESSMVVEHDDDDEPNFATDLSMTSMGGFAMLGGSTAIPDFIVTKATEFASHDKALLLVEVKACTQEVIQVSIGRIHESSC